MAKTIEHITAKEIVDSRGNPTLEVTVVADGAVGVFAVPSGASTGAHEAHELRDGGVAGKGHMQTAIAHIHDTIAPKLAGFDAADQRALDTLLLELDGTPDKSRLGGNTLLGVSIAAAKAAGGDEMVAHLRSLADIPQSRKEPLLFMNMINGGKHANTRLSFQEFQIIPTVESASEALAIGTAFYKELFDTLHDSVGEFALGDEGGAALDLEDVAEPLRIMSEVAERIGSAGQIQFGLDVAATSLYKDGSYSVGGKALSPEELQQLYAKLTADFPFLSIEDPFYEEDFAHFAALKAVVPKLQIIGDDLTTTNTTRLQQALDANSVTALIIKPNQAGTLSETLDTMALARKGGVHCVVSHRSGETHDNFIADLAFAFGCYGLKAGAPGPEERMSKYRQLVVLTSNTQ